MVTAALAAALGESHRSVVAPVVPAPATTGYRVQTKLMVSATRGGPLLGLYSPGTHRVVDSSRCPLHDRLIQRAIPIVRDALRTEALPIHGGGRRGVRYLLLRASVSERRLLLTLVTSRVPLAAAPRLARRLRSQLPLAGLLLNENTSPGNVILGPHTRRIWGEEELCERYGDVVLAAPTVAFVQANTRMAARIYAEIAAAAELRGRERVLDLYCGVGGIAFTLAPAAAEVLGIEAVEAAVEAARRNARRNGRPNVRFEVGQVEEVVAAAAQGADLVTLNPPRKGCGTGVARALAAARVPRLLYLSCAPASFARDAALLVAGAYRLRRVQPFDLLPQTDHVELLGCFEHEP
jgi:23S rRNA (uracil1939-C5)-methyltransferase